MFPWTDFSVGFLGNLAADLIVGVILFILLTNIPEKKKEKENLKIGMGLYFDELIINKKRLGEIQKYLENLNTNEQISTPLSLAHAAWDMIQEARLLTKVKNTRLVHHIFQLQEKTTESNIELKVIQVFIRSNPHFGKVDDTFTRQARVCCQEAHQYLDETMALIKVEMDKY